ncbi:hypothetical protein ACFLVK_01885 [Chloroflexota bacterium]
MKIERKQTGKSKAVEISELFKWTGYVSDKPSMDLKVKGYLDIGNLSLDWEVIYGSQIDGVVSREEFQA